MKKMVAFLLGLCLLLVTSPVFAQIQEYQIVDVQKQTLRGGRGENIKVIITTTNRDMSKMTGRDFAETAEAALQNVLHTPAGGTATNVNILLFESRYLDGTCLARAYKGKFGRTLEAYSGKGPSKKQIMVSETISELKGGFARTTTDSDYAEAARRLGMKQSTVKKLHFDLVGKSILSDFSSLIGTVPPIGPVRMAR